MFQDIDFLSSQLIDRPNSNNAIDSSPQSEETLQTSLMDNDEKTISDNNQDGHILSVNSIIFEDCREKGVTKRM